jgi:hypothetical protein
MLFLFGIQINISALSEKTKGQYENMENKQ